MSDSGVKRARAARALAAGATKAAAAREAEVDPATITRWSREPAFQDLVLRAGEPPDTPKDMAVAGLADLVPLALKVLKDGLEGVPVSTQQQAVALGIIDKAKKWEPKALSEDGPSTLFAAIQEIESAGKSAH